MAGDRISPGLSDDRPISKEVAVAGQTHQKEQQLCSLQSGY